MKTSRNPSASSDKSSPLSTANGSHQAWLRLRFRSGPANWSLTAPSYYCLKVQGHFNTAGAKDGELLRVMALSSEFQSRLLRNSIYPTELILTTHLNCRREPNMAACDSQATKRHEHGLSEGNSLYIL